MQHIQLNSKDGLAAGWIGVSDAHNLPERVRTAAPTKSEAVNEGSAGDTPTHTRSWLRTGLRFARNAVIGLALLTSVPFAVIGLVGGRFQSFESVNARARLQSTERLRMFMAPTDASITPMQAGVAFHALQASKAKAAFPMQNSGEPHARPWKTQQLTADMFAGVRAPASPGALWSAQILYAASSPLLPQEMGYLRAVAEASIWQDFDRVASARAVDIIGGQFVVPFPTDAFAPALSVLRYADTRELANAGIMRAAYYVGTRELDRAELALKSVVSFGFALIDNATNSLDAAIGRTIVETGRDGLLQLYSILGNEELIAQVRPPKLPVLNASASFGKRIDPDVLRERLLGDANNPNLPRGLRFEALRGLSFASCGNAREVLFGPNQQVRDAFLSAKQSLARYPSEQAYVDLLYRITERVPEDAGVRLGPERFIVGAATIAGVVLNNPRVAACTRMSMLSF